MVGLLVADLDGTIVFDRAVSARDRDALNAWRAAGNLLAIDTGKSIFATDSVLSGAGFEFDFCICYTGAVLTDGSYNVLSARYLPNEVVSGVVDSLRDQRGVSVFATVIDNDFRLLDNTDELSSILPLFTPLELGDIPNHEFVGVPIQVADADLIEPLLAELTNTWRGVADCHRNQNFLDLVPAGCNKGSGLRDLLDGPLSGQDLVVWTIGDSWNDLDMHAIADHPITLPWAPPEVTSACERTVPSLADLVDSILESGA